ncbi:hypothetical protein Tco_0838677 [Tanacetum coccineum]|uniref:Uncharacterized protein n=1 Tax=Tanacetum coccineum TaxID=301880 RepID=A0ABQ5ANG4_9ASTR
MAQQIIPADQLVPKFQVIGRCNNYDVLQSIPCSLECKIGGQILLDHPLSYALTATADVPTVYLQQFWKTVHKVPKTKDTIRFKLDTQEITYTVDMFRDTLKLSVETPDNLFVVPATIEIIKSFMNMVGYQGVVDKTKINILQLFHVVINQKNVDYAALLWGKFVNYVQQKKNVIQIDEDYHSIKDDIPLVSVYTTWNVTDQEMLIPDAFLTEEIRATDDYTEYETVFVNVVVLMNQPQPGKKRKHSAEETSSPQKSMKVTIQQKQVVEGEKDVESYDDHFDASMIHDDVDDSEDKIKPESYKEHPEVFDDDDNNEEKKDEKEGDVMGCLEIRTEKMQSLIPTTPRSPRINLSLDKNISQELTNIVSISTPTTFKDSHKKRRISSKYSHLPGALSRMCRLHKKVDQVLHEIVPQLAERATDDLIENNLKPCIAETIIEDRDAFLSKVLDLVSQEFNAQAPKIIEELFKNYVQTNVIQVHPTTTTSNETTSSADLQQQLYLKIRSNLQDQANDPALWDVLKYDAPPEGEKRVKRHKTSKSSNLQGVLCQNNQLNIPQLMYPSNNNNNNNRNGMHGKRKQLLMKKKIEATLNDMLSNQFRNAEEYAYHLEQEINFMENQIRNPNEPPRYLYNKDLFFLKYGNTEEKKYILSLHKIHAERFPEVDLEEKMNRWVRKEFKIFNEDAWLSIQHWKDSWHKRVYKQNQRRVRDNPEYFFSNYRITEVVRITIDQPYGLDFMEQVIVMRENDKPDSFFEADFKYLNKNDIEDLYYLCRNTKANYQETKLMNSLITFIRSRVIWERVHDFQLGMESYQIKVNLTDPTLTFPGIEEYEPYSIVDKPTTGLIYLNNKDEKQVMYLVEIVKFCDATLEKVLKEVKLKSFNLNHGRNHLCLAN